VNRRQRRALNRRADKVLARLHGHPIEADADAAPRTHAVIVSEGTTPGIVRREDMGPALAVFGLYLDGLDAALAEIARSPQDDGRRFPVLILIDGWLSCAWMELHALSRGGTA
jgi:hypothetical protein